MYVGHRHENADQLASIVEIFVFFDLFDHYNLAVGRCYHHIFRIAREDAHRASEEIDDNSENDDERCKDNIESERAALEEQPVVKRCYNQKCGTGERQRGASFVVQTVLLYFREL